MFIQLDSLLVEYGAIFQKDRSLTLTKTLNRAILIQVCSTTS